MLYVRDFWREREREREKERGKKGERERETDGEREKERESDCLPCVVCLFVVVVYLPEIQQTLPGALGVRDHPLLNPLYLTDLH